MSRIVQPPNDDARVKMTSCPEIDQLRTRWLDLMRRALPEAALKRPDWPIRLDHCFGRVILDAVHGRPWREVLPAPAWRNMDEPTLRRAVALAEAILDGSADLHVLNAASLRMRGHRRVVP
jgi:hypothetical protein